MLPALIAAGAQLGAAALSNQAPATPGMSGPSGGALGNKADVDFSGWTVATGGSRADGAQISKSSADSMGGAPASPVGAALQSLGMSSTALWVAGGVVGVAVLWRMLKK